MSNSFKQESFIILKDNTFLQRQKIAGKCVAKCHKAFIDLINNNTPNISLKDIEAECVRIINDNKCFPTFKGYNGFPGAVCLSVNTQLVHGIPTDYKLQQGDIVSLDLGATFEGAIADAAYTCIYGEPKNKEHVRLLNVCQAALKNGINAIEVGKKLGAIGNAIHKSTKDSGFNLITNYGGHGIDYNKPHAEPFVSNQEKTTEGIRIQSGLSIAIEPMLVIGSSKTKVESDNWTVSTEGMGCHFEHSVTVMDDKVHIITDQSCLD